MRAIMFVFVAMLTLLSVEGRDKFPSSNCVWYAQPAKVWESQTLPIGNGRIGGTIYGGDQHDCVTLNEVSLWSGGPNLPGNGSGYSYGPTSGANEFGSYQPFGNLVIDYELDSTRTKMYARALSLKNGIAITEFENNGVKHTREAFVSHPDDVLVYSAKVSKPGGLSAAIGLTPFHSVDYSVVGKDVIVMRGTLANGEKFEGRLFVKAKGSKASVKIASNAQHTEVTYTGNGDGMKPEFDGKSIPAINVSNADSFEIYITLATDYKEDFKANWKGEDPAIHNDKVLSRLAKRSYSAIRKAHIANHSALYSRLDISVGKTSPDIAALPTDQRIQKYKSSHNDPELEALVYQYGRYVLIAGSRPGNLPLTLQGIWNDKVHAPWACDYHNNINLQMCYWGAEVGNLSECHLTFIDFMKAMEEPLHNMTQKAFGADKKGWTTRISQNIWGAGGWVKWNPPVNAWYALHVWDHFCFTNDREFLQNTGYPIMKSICEFWETMLKEAPDGKLVSPNGWSHEWGPVEDGISHDQQLIWELFDNTIKAAKILKADEGWAKKIAGLKSRLAMPQVSPNGYLQEWREDRPDMVSGHRHTSHLIGAFPGTMLWKQENSDKLIPAAAESLKLRGTTGDCRRSWTWPWRTALWARFGNSDEAYNMVKGYISHNLLDNLFGNHPPMQMDGTYGMTGGMSEMFIQSHSNKIVLLPAIPAEWKTGFVHGIRARGNYTVDIDWKDGKVTKYKFYTTNKSLKPIEVEVNGKMVQVTPEPEK